MKQLRKRGAGVLLALALVLGAAESALAAVPEDALAEAVTDTARYLCETVKAPQVGSIGGEWAVLGLARSGCGVPEAYYQDYYAAVEAYVKACGGVLHNRKYTEYSRVIVALSAIGRDARNVAGYDLTKPLGDYGKTVWQGLNGPIWALLALDSRNYPMPQNPEAATQATRQMYVDEILSRQLDDGGWSLTGRGGSGTADPDITGMALQALAKYQDQSAVKQATEEALACMSRRQEGDGGFSTLGTGTSESCVQMLVALCELGISLEDPRFVKNGSTVLDGLLAYYRPGKGFLHTAGGSGSSQMATEQGFYGLVAAQRALQGRNSLYRMDDAAAVSPGQGPAGRHADVQAQPVTAPGRTFADISGAHAHPNQTAIEALASRGILQGYDESHFGPDQTMTRAQFAAVVVRALGLPLQATGVFSDVKATDWCAAYVGTAYTYGIVNGTTATTFHPNGTITRQEAAVMTARAAGLCGLDTSMDSAAVRDTLAPFGDAAATGAWARESLAFCYSAGILDASGLEIRPGTAIRRCEVAQMLYNLLGSAGLL